MNKPLWGLYGFKANPQPDPPQPPLDECPMCGDDKPMTALLCRTCKDCLAEKECGKEKP